MADGFPKDTALQRTYRAFESLSAADDSAIDLAQAALLIATIEYPGLDIAYYLAQLDVLAGRVRSQLSLPASATPSTLPADIAPHTIIAAMNTVLLVEEHFHGNTQDYYNPDNSFLNKILEDHVGIPITLALLYIEVGRRVGIELVGIGLPYHFIVGYPAPHETLYLDPYTDDQILSMNDCIERIREIAQRRIKIHAHWFAPVARKMILVRILNNLKKAYLDRDDYVRTLTICDLLLLLHPDAAIELRDRGHIHLQLKHYGLAYRDLTAYLKLAPQASDRYEILNHLKIIRQTIAKLN